MTIELQWQLSLDASHGRLHLSYYRRKARGTSSKNKKKMYTNNKCCTCVIKGNCYSLYSVLHQDRYHTVDYISWRYGAVSFYPWYEVCQIMNRIFLQNKILLMKVSPCWHAVTRMIKYICLIESLRIKLATLTMGLWGSGFLLSTLLHFYCSGKSLSYQATCKTAIIWIKVL